jgi:hypothetical protein
MSTCEGPAVKDSTEPRDIYPERMARLHVEAYPDPVCERLGVHPADAYVEHCWLPVIGPSSTLLLRRLAAGLEALPEGYDLDLAALGRDLGLSARAGRNAPLRRSLERLARFGLARWSGPETYQVRRRIPTLSARHVERLGPGPLAVHRRTLQGRDQKRNGLLQAALRYAALGWPVFPLRPAAKVPEGSLVPHGLLEATCDPRRIAAWWSAAPAANVGIRTGLSLDVVDVDGPEARKALEQRCPEVLASGLAVATGRGWHLYFAASGLASRAGVISGVDVRGSGGYVVAPPSAHPSGSRYRFVHLESGAALEQLPAALAAVPRSFVDLARPERSQPPSREPRSLRVGIDAYARRALDDECTQVAATEEGRRNERLNRAAFAMGTLVGAEALDARTAAARLLEAAGRAGLAEREAMRTISSGLKAGSAQPRRLADTTGGRAAAPDEHIQARAAPPRRNRSDDGRSHSQRRTR